MRRSTRTQGAALALFTAAAICLWADNAPRTRQSTPVAPTPLPVRPALSPAERVASPATGLPAGAVALAALTEAAQTTVVAITAEGQVEPLAGPSVVDEHSLAFRGNTLAYLWLAGLDPTQNFVEVLDFGRGVGWQIRPEAGSAIFGLALDPQGARLAYLEADARVAASQAPWWVVTVNLAAGEKNAILDGAQLGRVALSPLAWGSEMILFRGLVPFAGQYHGLWASRPDGSDLRQLTGESDYVGRPRLSPEGERLALLVSDSSALPAGYGAGEPPANAIRILGLRGGESTLIAPLASGRDWAAMDWTGEGLIAIGGEWEASRNSFTHRSLMMIRLDSGAQPENVLSMNEGEFTQVTACPEGGWLAAARSGGTTEIMRSGQAEPLATFAGPSLAWLVCIGAEEAAR